MQVLYKAKALQAEKETFIITKTPTKTTKEEIKTSYNQPQPDWKTTVGGPNIFTDAAWKCNVIPITAGSNQKENTGIGIYLEWNREDHEAIYIQVPSNANSALQAEAQAMETTALVGKALQVQSPRFLTDSLILAQAIQREDPANHPGHWSIRPNLNQFFKHSRGLKARIIKIRRENNREAHNLAQQAIRIRSLRVCLYNCSKHPSHQCPLIDVISNLNVHSCTLLSVTCK
jgi:hypothetical protein